MKENQLFLHALNTRDEQQSMDQGIKGNETAFARRTPGKMSKAKLAHDKLPQQKRRECRVTSAPPKKGRIRLKSEGTRKGDEEKRTGRKEEEQLELLFVRCLYCWEHGAEALCSPRDGGRDTGQALPFVRVVLPSAD